MFSSVDSSVHGNVDWEVSRVASQLHENLPALTMSMRDRLATQISELRDDERMIQLLGASIEDNIETILYGLRHGIPREHVQLPPAAFEYARRLAQRGVPVNALLRAYRLGQDHLLKWTFDTVEHHVGDPSTVLLTCQEFVTWTFGYIDWISQQVVAVYEKEREQWLENRNAVRAHYIKEIINGAEIDTDVTEAAIGYGLRQRHVGMVLWGNLTSPREDELGRLEGFAIALAAHLGCSARPLTVPVDRTSLWVWLPIGTRRTVDMVEVRRFAETYEAAPDGACGKPGAGVDGFRQSHQQALCAQAVALIYGGATPAFIGFGEPGVATASLLSKNVPATRSWVHRVLGPLALDDEPHHRLRHTLMVFLAGGGSYTAAAERLDMHKNSVKYRVTKADDERGKPVSDDRVDVELALLACRWLGAAVLRTEPPDRAPAGRTQYAP
ncbi:PucR C-terminal helix-turn-helix domain-containing protein [Haloechinothrix alba]|uniref:PucR C-terminal helix-turn-helix domain-containing protein n=1 Tax=Haloechinothrix alba TaxID=664784 RepID=A0A238ZMD4_9PSEU|nr:helix-turn-helix domain-containing protein [Haloechinothrix alba]SNR84289.1 PucR C-terminal helix-turn-helix domain-containing protein [Haloechinothrix alba]